MSRRCGHAVPAIRPRTPLPSRWLCLLSWLLLLPLLLALTGCGMLKREPKPAEPEWKSLTLAAADDANGNSALAVDVVLIKDKGMLESLAAMPAARYFAGRADLQRTYPDALTVLAVEITPGQVIKLDSARFKDQRAWAALAFAQYANPGEHRVRLPLNSSGYTLQLNAQGLVVVDPSSAPAR
jgi:type VI secretion system protein